MADGDAYVFPGFLTPVPTQFFFPKPPTTFLTCFCRGERRKHAGKKSRLNQGSNSQPPGHESDTLTTEPSGRGRWIRTLILKFTVSDYNACTENSVSGCHLHNHTFNWYNHLNSISSCTQYIFFQGTGCFPPIPSSIQRSAGWEEWILPNLSSVLGKKKTKPGIELVTHFFWSPARFRVSRLGLWHVLKCLISVFLVLFQDSPVIL